jgi:hypothetical protein
LLSALCLVLVVGLAASLPAATASGYPKTEPRGVSCSEPEDCVRVGRTASETSVLIERWNGTDWFPEIVPNPNYLKSPPYNLSELSLDAVSCWSSSGCVAVGKYHIEGMGDIPLIERWNGSAWSVQNFFPTGYGTEQFWQLHDISCVSASFCMATGSSELPVYGISEPWSLAILSSSTTGPATFFKHTFEAEVKGVSCLSSTSCTAVGKYQNPSTSEIEPTAEHWNGTAWSSLTPVTPSGFSSSTFTDVACVGPSNEEECHAVGNETDGSGRTTAFSERYDSSLGSYKWLYLGPSNAQLEYSEAGADVRMSSVSCPEREWCTGVGTILDGEGTTWPFAAVGEGEWEWALGVPPVWEWEPGTPPALPEGDTAFTGVWCGEANSCMAVGYHSDGESEAIWETGTGREWSIGEPPLGDPPLITSKGVADVSSSGATLGAEVNPGGLPTTYQFEYGTTASYGTSVPVSPEEIGAGSSPVEVSQAIEGLKEGQTYHYRVVAENIVGTDHGEDQTFKTIFTPDVVTEEPEEVEGEDAILTGSVDPNGTATSYQFEYGTTTAYGTVVAPDEAGDGEEAIEVIEAVSGLEPETTYHYRAVATSAAGVDYGADKTLTTGAAGASSGGGSVPGNFFGMMWTGDLDQTEEPHVLAAVKNSGARILRLAMRPGFEHNYEEIFRHASQRGITVLPYIGEGAWPLGSAEQKEWKDRAMGWVEKYGPGGSFWKGGGQPAYAWEIWNEPNLPSNSPVETVKDPDNPYERIAAEQFGDFFHKVAEGMDESAKKVEENIEILAPGLFGFGASNCKGKSGECHLSPANFLAQMGHTSDYDAVSLHPYVFKVGSGEGHAPCKTKVPCSTDIVDVKSKVKNYVSGVRRELQVLKEGGKPIWVTELGFPAENRAGNAATFPPVAESTQKEEIEATFGMLKNERNALGVAHAFYYNIQDYRKPSNGEEWLGWDYHSGLRKGKGGNRPAWKGFASTTPHGRPNWSSAKKAKNSKLERMAFKGIPGFEVETEGAEYQARAEWGSGELSGSYPNATGWEKVEAAPGVEGEGEEEAVDVQASTPISGLSPEHVYHYRIAVKDEDGDIEYESTGHQFETKPAIEASIRSLNGEPGWVNVSGHVESKGAAINGTEVNVNFKKKEGGTYVFNEAESTHATIVNGDYSLTNWQIGRGEWQVNVVFPGQGENPKAETGLESFTIKNGYHLVNQNSGKCLEVSYGSSENGMSIHQEPCGSGQTAQAQTFTLVPSPSNPVRYEIVNRKSGKCLDVKEVSSADGASIQQYTCQGWSQANQVFEGVPSSSSDPSHVKFIAQHSSKCLDITGSSTADGALLQQWSCNGTGAQAFGFESVEADPVPTHAYVTLDETLYGHPGYQTLHGTVEAPQSVSGQTVYVNFKKWDGSKYVFTSQAAATLNGAGQYSVAYWGVGAGDWEAIAIYPGSGALGESRTDEGTHKFHVGDGYRFAFRNTSPHKCLSTNGGGTSNGTAILQWSCASSANPTDGQVYSVEPVGTAGSNYFRIRPDSDTSKCLDITGGPGATENGATVQLWSCIDDWGDHTNQVFHIVQLASPNQEWFAFLPVNSGKCVTVSEDSTANGASFLQWDCAWAGSQQWQWEPIG